MKLLFDANLSWRLTNLLKKDYPQSLHVSRTGLKQPARDVEIWNYALRHQLTVVTNDEDYYQLSVMRGFPPKVILLLTGNQSTGFIAELLRRHKESIARFIQSEDYGLMEIY